MTGYSAFIHKALLIGISFSLLAGCQGKQESDLETNREKQINQLESRLEELERRVGQHLPPYSENVINTPKGPIKSLTFRMGTQDDRLRIYWEDGSKSDLPCTKEQKIWVCG